MGQVHTFGKYEWICPVCNIRKFLTFRLSQTQKYCSRVCRNRSDYHRQKVSEGLKGKPTWNKNKKGYNTSRLGMKHSNETKIKMSLVHRFNINPEKAYIDYFKTKKSKPTKYEKQFKQYLIKHNIPFKQQISIGNKYQVDFIINEKDIIEIDGAEHYKKGKLNNDNVMRDNFLKQQGYNIKHIKNEEVKSYV